MATAETDSLEKYSCTICLEIFEDPVTVPCGNNHVFCKNCVKPQLSDPEVRCTLCREKFDKKKIKKCTDMVQILQSRKGTCYGCSQKIPLKQMKFHLRSCDKIDRSIPEFHPIQPTSQHYPRDEPNRATFQCPYCKAQNLTCTGLVDHCNEEHKENTAAVVCPVCVSMPWGDPSKRSQNFIQHLNLRHRFEYDTYVEFDQNEDDMLQAAIQASLTNS